MRNRTLLLIVILLTGSALFAQDTTVSAKVDTMLNYQREMMVMQQKIYDEVQYIPPLANKWGGVELNLARWLVSAGESYTAIAGTFSLFNVSRSGELAFPFFYKKGTRKADISFSDETYDLPLTHLNFDVTYRQFLGKYQDGFYFSGGTRYTYIKGIEGTDTFLFNFNTGTTESTSKKLGAFFGIGYRYFTQSGLYWGTSIIYGRYFSGGETGYQEVVFDDSKVIIDIEFLKFGFAF